jgi:hypothetical protein
VATARTFFIWESSGFVSKRDRRASSRADTRSPGGHFKERTIAIPDREDGGNPRKNRGLCDLGARGECVNRVKPSDSQNGSPIFGFERRRA